MTFWPEGEPRIHAQVISISEPFDCRRKAEVTLSINNRQEVHGEIKFIVPAGSAHNYRLGDVYAAHFKRVSEMSVPHG